jgi:hypothetical protein
MLEEVVAIGSDGGRPLFSWGFGALESVHSPSQPAAGAVV